MRLREANEPTGREMITPSVRALAHEIGATLNLVIEQSPQKPRLAYRGLMVWEFSA